MVSSPGRTADDVSTAGPTIGIILVIGLAALAVFRLIDRTIWQGIKEERRNKANIWLTLLDTSTTLLFYHSEYRQPFKSDDLGSLPLYSEPQKYLPTTPSYPITARVISSPIPRYSSVSKRQSRALRGMCTRTNIVEPMPSPSQLEEGRERIWGRRVPCVLGFRL
jgi:hypothetical protein